MNLLFAHDRLGDFGGAETFIRLTAREFRERGHAVALLHGNGVGHNQSQWGKVFNESFCLPSCGSSQVLDEALERFDPDLIFVNNWEDLKSLERLISTGLPVVRMVHDHSLYCLRSYKYNVFTRKICRRRASAYCVFPCLGSVARNPQGSFPIRLKSYFAKKKEIALNRRCTAVLAYSEYQRGELIANGFAPERVHLTMPMRVHNPEGLRTSYNERNLVLFAGQVIRGKGVDALLRALSRVTCPFECIILGDGSHRPKCERLCTELGLSDRVTFKGYVPPAQMKQFYLEATVFAVSSLWPEPFGMVGPEAMRYGLPVVAFDAGAIGEWLKDGENGFLVGWNDVAAFAEKMELLLRNKDLARSLGARAMESVQRFDAGSQMDELELLFSRLISSTRSVASKAVNMELSVSMGYE